MSRLFALTTTLLPISFTFGENFSAFNKCSHNIEYYKAHKPENPCNVWLTWLFTSAARPGGCVRPAKGG